MRYNRQLRMMVESILTRPEGNRWQVQGLGMLRCYLDEAKRFRLHVWDSSLRTPGVSAIHNHPWNLLSIVIAGCYKQHRYVSGGLPKNNHTEEYNRVTIKCGEDACTVSKPELVKLTETPLEIYKATSGFGIVELPEYQQSANEIHQSIPDDGTVTLVERTYTDKSPDHAEVYWRGKGPWVDAKPRPATESELYSVTERALDFWF